MTEARALGPQGRLMGVEHPKAEKPLMLEPGEFGKDTAARLPLAGSGPGAASTDGGLV